MPANRSNYREEIELLVFGHYLRTGHQADLEEVLAAYERKFNPNHDELGRFASGPGVSATYLPSKLKFPGRINTSSGPVRRSANAKPQGNTDKPDLNQNEIVVSATLESRFDAVVGQPRTVNANRRQSRHPSTSVPSTANETVARIGSIITRGEGNYESCNTGTKDVPDDKVGHSFSNPPIGTITGMTINQILATRPLSGYNRRRMFATGKYQTTLDTLNAAKRALHLTGDEKYTADLQERVFREFLIYKAGGGKLAAFVIHGRGGVNDAQYAAAQEWASIGVPAGLPDRYGVVSNGYRSYYQKTGQNAASVSSTRALRSLLIEMANQTSQNR